MMKPRESVIPESPEEIKIQLQKVTASLQMRDKQLDILAKEASSAAENLKKVP